MHDASDAQLEELALEIEILHYDIARKLK